MDKKVIMENSWTLQIAQALKLPPPLKKKKQSKMPNASPFLLHSGPGTFAHHDLHDSCHPVKIPGLLSECSLFLCCSNTWKEEEGSFSGNPTSRVMGMRQEWGQKMVLESWDMWEGPSLLSVRSIGLK